MKKIRKKMDDDLRREQEFVEEMWVFKELI